MEHHTYWISSALMCWERSSEYDSAVLMTDENVKSVRSTRLWYVRGYVRRGVCMNVSTAPCLLMRQMLTAQMTTKFLSTPGLLYAKTVLVTFFLCWLSFAVLLHEW